MHPAGYGSKSKRPVSIPMLFFRCIPKYDSNIVNTCNKKGEHQNSWQVDVQRWWNTFWLIPIVLIWQHVSGRRFFHSERVRGLLSSWSGHRSCFDTSFSTTFTKREGEEMRCKLQPAITWECDLIYPLEPTLATCGMVGFKPHSNKRCTLHIFKFRWS